MKKLFSISLFLKFNLIVLQIQQANEDEDVNFVKSFSFVAKYKDVMTEQTWHLYKND